MPKKDEKDSYQLVKDLPVDFADASLIAAAEREDIKIIIRFK
ncbi:hypothetical protein [Halanaerobium congolense]|nr:hypothetical protein [Halanaerobium congolense]